jgi:hypothetical protein
MPPFEIQVFSPSSRQPLPSRLAVVSILATSEPLLGSESAKAEIAVPARVFSSQARCCSVPNSVTGPMPSPCMAKAKSASPSWRASVSRIRQSVRTSSAEAPAPPEWVSTPALPSAATRALQAASVSEWSTGRASRHQLSSSSASARCRSSKNGQSRKLRSDIPLPCFFSSRLRRLEASRDSAPQSPSKTGFSLATKAR